MSVNPPARSHLREEGLGNTTSTNRGYSHLITRRRLVAGLLGTMAAGPIRGRVLRIESDYESDVVRVAFGSCVSQRKNQDVWEHIAEKDPHLFIMMGDGVYPEHEPGALSTLDAIRSAYRHAGKCVELNRFRERIPVAAIWDDNDYGGMDIGRTFAHKFESRDLFLDFWTSGAEASIRRRDSGIYASWELGMPERRIQIIAPDLRFSRSEWAMAGLKTIIARQLRGMGPFEATRDSGATMLGETQWAWLEDCLRRPAKLRLFVSSIQVIPGERGWECWSNFPAEQERLLRLISQPRVGPVIVLSGDAHYAEISRKDGDEGIGALWEITSSGLTEHWPTPGPNSFRIGPAYPQPNFGILTVDWRPASPQLTVGIHGADGRRLRREFLLLESLMHSPSGGSASRTARSPQRFMA